MVGHNHTNEIIAEIRKVVGFLGENTEYASTELQPLNEEAEPATLVLGDIPSKTCFSIVAKTAGLAGNDITIQLVAPSAASQSLGVVVVGKTITVNLATNEESVVTTTAAQVVEALNTDNNSKALIVAALVENDGSGVVAGMDQAIHLGNGADADVVSAAHLNDVIQALDEVRTCLNRLLILIKDF